MQEDVVLISVTGDDRPEVADGLLQSLADHEVAVLDVGQAVIHDQMTLGLVVRIPRKAEAAAVLKDVLFRAHELGVTARFQPIERSRYAEWVAQQGRPRYIVTLLARGLTARQLARVGAIVRRHGLTVDTIRRLSGRAPLEGDDPRVRASVELSVRGEPHDEQALRGEFLEASAALDIDIAFQLDNVYRRNRRLVAFDMDSTLIEAEVIDELARIAGVGDQVAAITERAMRGELDFKQSFRQRVALLNGLDAQVLEDVAANLPLTEGAERLVTTLKRFGYKTAILSGGFQYFGRHIQRRLGIDYVFANELEIRDGRVTGEVAGDVVDGARKAELLREIAASERIALEQVIAVGDGANDLPMLSVAGLGIAFRAKPLVRESAEHSISTLGLDGILYLLGFTDQDLD